jgi:hypothetical protein
VAPDAISVTRAAVSDAGCCAFDVAEPATIAVNSHRYWKCDFMLGSSFMDGMSSGQVMFPTV